MCCWPTKLHPFARGLSSACVHMTIAGFKLTSRRPHMLTRTKSVSHRWELNSFSFKFREKKSYIVSSTNMAACRVTKIYTVRTWESSSKSPYVSNIYEEIRFVVGKRSRFDKFDKNTQASFPGSYVSHLCFFAWSPYPTDLRARYRLSTTNAQRRAKGRPSRAG